MKRWLLDLLRSVGLYVVLIVGGIVCFLSLAPVFGYLPYSDRPGPGWIGNFPAIGWATFRAGLVDMSGWGLLLAPYAAAAGVIVFSLVRLLERLRTPRFVVALIGALLAGWASGYLVRGIGWYIAIGWAPVSLAMALGLVFGAWLLPRGRGAGRGSKEPR